MLNLQRTGYPREDGVFGPSLFAFFKPITTFVSTNGLSSAMSASHLLYVPHSPPLLCLAGRASEHCGLNMAMFATEHPIDVDIAVDVAQ